MVAEIVALPLAFAVTSPDDDTVATLVLLDVQLMLYMASDGMTVAVSCVVLSATIVNAV